MKWINLSNITDTTLYSDTGYTCDDDSVFTPLTYTHLDNVDRNRNISINTWGVRRHDTIDCDVVFDLRNFQSKVSSQVNIKHVNGLTEVIQDSIRVHRDFLVLMDIIVDFVEKNNPKKIGIVCSYGKHRSVAWAEILRKDVYSNAKVKHNCTDYSFLKKFN